jgi:hypothetical protein
MRTRRRKYLNYFFFRCDGQYDGQVGPVLQAVRSQELLRLQRLVKPV